MNIRTLAGALCALVFSLGAARADTIITLWNFNSLPPDASTGTGSLLPSFGTGTASPIGGVLGTFAAGSPRDPAADNSAWSLASWPAQGTASGTAGAVFMTSTAGFTDPIQITMDLRFTTTASGNYQLQATTDGTNFFNVSGGVASFGAVGNNTATNFTSGGLFSNTVAASNQGFVQNVSYTFAPDSAFENNPQFGVRLVSVFDGSTYEAAGSSATYGTSGTVRIDMVTVSAVSGAAVPEPATTAAWMGATVLLFVLTHRRIRERRKRAG